MAAAIVTRRPSTALRSLFLGERALANQQSVRLPIEMNTFRRLLLVVLLGISAACHYNPSPVTLRGSPPEIAALAGEWVGEYTGSQSGRSGSISLRITAGGDAAHGEREHLAHARSADVLRISFVRVAQGEVTGVLEPYIAPDCQCRVTTSFTGSVKGDTIDGTFTTRGSAGLEQTGRWRVSRGRS